MTDVALNRPWFLYEMAFLRGRLGQIPLLRFGARALDSHPLSAVQDLDGFDFESILTLAGGLLNEHDEVTRNLALDAISLKAPDWSALLEPIGRRQARSSGLRVAINSLSQTLSNERLFRSLAGHSCMRELACKALDDVGSTFKNVLISPQNSFRVDYRRYPEYLTHLQSALSCRTLAVALVEDIEEFWAEKTGKQIMNSTSHDSQRIFVFANQSLLDKYFGNVVNHAEKYGVFVMSSSEFSRASRYRTMGDFSILTDPRTGQQVTAFYDNAAHNVQFTTDEDAIASNLSIFEDVLTRAHRIVPAKDDTGNKQNREDLKLQMFSPSSDDGQHHSDWIPIYRYDAFEEDHPYYKEMHERMLQEFRSRVVRHNEPFQVLEIGAGTGHFTKKLAQQRFPGMTIKAMEPDPGAQRLLDQKLQHKAATVQSIAASAINYDPRGEFRFVFSSFSEHHIRPEDKQRYFRTLLGTMEEGAYLIVGDEFLSSHDHTDSASYLDALERYHAFIIREANERGFFEVASLEELAWQSGKPDAKVRIDYKVTLNRYKSFAVKAGLDLEAEFCVSPQDLAETFGGMYVLVFRKPRGTSPAQTLS